MNKKLYFILSLISIIKSNKADNFMLITDETYFFDDIFDYNEGYNGLNINNYLMTADLFSSRLNLMGCSENVNNADLELINNMSHFQIYKDNKKSIILSTNNENINIKNVKYVNILPNTFYLHKIINSDCIIKEIVKESDFSKNKINKHYIINFIKFI